jgi:hypothetical protein
MLSFRALAAATSWAVFGFALEAAEAGGSPLFVFHGPAEPGVEESRARAALEGLAERLGTVLVDLSPSSEPPPRTTRHLARAIDAYLAFDYRGTLEHVAAGVTEVRRTGGHGLSSAEISDLFLYRGFALAELGDEAGAWEALVRAATLDPTRVLDPARFPPSAVSAFGRAKDAVVAGARAELVVSVDERCTVAVDGRQVRPRRPVELPAGEHLVRVECPGLAPYAELVTVAPPRTELVPEIPMPAPPTPARAAELAGARGVHRALLALVTAGDGAASTLTLVLVDAQGRPRGQVVSRLDRDADVAALAERLLGPADAIVVDPGDARTAGAKRRPWVWAIAGAAAAAAATTLVGHAIFDRGSQSGFRIRIGGQVP